MGEDAYDVCYFDRQNFQETAMMLKRFGFKGAYFLIKFESSASFKKAKEEMEKSAPPAFDARAVMLIETANAKALIDAIRSRDSDAIAVKGLMPEVLRKASETKSVDMIVSFLDESRRSMIDYVTSNFCRENGIKINFEFSQLLKSEGKDRSNVFSALLETAKIARKRKAETIVSSGASNKWEVRALRELQAFGRALGL